MGKKINPKVFRLGITNTWPSRWFKAGSDYVKGVEQDVKTRRFLVNHLREAGVDRIEIKRNADKIEINIHTAKPGLIIGRGGTGIDDLKKKLHSKFLKSFRPGDIKLNVMEVSRPNLSAQIVLQSMALEIEKRMPFKRVMKQAINRIERAGAMGAKISISGRLNGAEIARCEKIASGKIPLQTLRADIDYARGAASTTYGAIGIKVWIYKGYKFDKAEDKKGEVIGAKNSGRRSRK